MDFKYDDIEEKKSKIANYRYRLFKIMIDIVGCSLILLITLPVIILACLSVFLEDRKKAIYVQKRVGLNNKEFDIYKIRSMIINAEEDGAKWAESKDPRITKVGRFIRKTRIDELPQLVNVLKGDMSLIGPRPERRIFYKKFENEIPNFRKRLTVKPGITGYAQVRGGYDLTPNEKINLDLEYIQKASIGVDLKIIFKTIIVVITGNGAR